VDIENDTFDYDKFTLNTVSRFQSWIAVGSSYWNIDVIDIGSEPVGFAYDNVQSNTSVYIPYADSLPILDSSDFDHPYTLGLVVMSVRYDYLLSKYLRHIHEIQF
jgi:hypothetical protein